MHEIHRHDLRQMRLKDKKYSNIMQKLCFQHAKCGILKRKTRHFTKQKTTVFRAKSSDLQPFSGLFYMRNKTYQSTARHNTLIIRQILKRLKNMSFSYRNGFRRKIAKNEINMLTQKSLR